MKKVKISIIAAIGKNRELGKDNKLLWHIPEDLQHFKKLTENHVVIMGRKTFESIGKPLPNRINIIITRNRAWTPLALRFGGLGCTVCYSLEEGLVEAKKNKNEIFIIGGGEIYKQGIKYADKLYLTIVDQEYPEADTYFPDYSDFKKVIKEEKKSDGKFTYKFIDLEK